MGGETATSARGGGTAISRDELQVLADEMTMGDIWRASKESDGDRAELGMRSFWHSARRQQLIAQDVDFEGFIDLVRQEDFQAVNQRRAVDRDEGKTPTP
jgi:hypothetical protein